MIVGNYTNSGRYNRGKSRSRTMKKRRILRNQNLNSRTVTSNNRRLNTNKTQANDKRNNLSFRKLIGSDKVQNSSVSGSSAKSGWWQSLSTSEKVAGVSGTTAATVALGVGGGYFSFLLLLLRFNGLVHFCGNQVSEGSSMSGLIRLFMVQILSPKSH